MLSTQLKNRSITQNGFIFPKNWKFKKIFELPPPSFKQHCPPPTNSTPQWPEFSTPPKTPPSSPSLPRRHRSPTRSLPTYLGAPGFGGVFGWNLWVFSWQITQKIKQYLPPQKKGGGHGQKTDSKFLVILWRLEGCRGCKFGILKTKAFWWTLLSLTGGRKPQYACLSLMDKILHQVILLISQIASALFFNRTTIPLLALVLL